MKKTGREKTYSAKFAESEQSLQVFETQVNFTKRIIIVIVEENCNLKPITNLPSAQGKYLS